MKEIQELLEEKGGVRRMIHQTLKHKRVSGLDHAATQHTSLDDLTNLANSLPGLPLSKRATTLSEA